MAYQHQSSPNHPGADAQPGDILTVVHNFDARSADELTLQKGDHICLVELDDGFGDGWYLGRHMAKGTTGLFPGVYTQRLPTRPSPSSAPLFRPPLPTEPESSQVHNRDSALYHPETRSNADHQRTLTHVEPADHPPSSPKGLPSPNSTTSSMTEDSEHFSSLTRALATSKRNLPRTISQTIAQTNSGQDSPVMNETLSVIDEHITDLSTPRHSMAARDARPVNDSASDYSATPENRLSYVAGPETDEEEEEMLTRANVQKWTSQETATYLRQVGIDSKHCQIFQDQEITGDVLLDMDQEFINMKEYDFGVMGKRLRTWHKIRQLQEQVKGTKQSRESAQSRPTSDRQRSRAQSTATTLPKMWNIGTQSDANARRSASYGDAHSEHVPAPLQTQSIQSLGNQSNVSTESSLSARRASAVESPSRPSAASIREMSHHTRQRSSQDVGTPSTFDLHRRSEGTTKRTSTHKHQGSFDQDWSLTVPDPQTHGAHHPAAVSDARHMRITVERPGHRGSARQPSADLDRGYLSGPESESSRPRNYLKKRDGTCSANHSRNSSTRDQQMRDLPVSKRHSRVGSADSIRDVVPAFASPAAQAYHGKGFKGRFRAASARTPPTSANPSSGMLSPTVTNLESHSPGLSLPSSGPGSDVSGASSPLPPNSMKSKLRPKRSGVRTISDAVTDAEKEHVVSPASAPSSSRDTPLHSPSRTGSSTPSATSRSFDIDHTDTSSKGAEGTGYAGSTARAIARGKTKKETSAYTKGLEMKSPAEQRHVCDYSGWMKKKSSSLMAAWKPRLFFLRGRRLSYYYSEDDTQERGVIDISSHKVLRADHETMANLHASITASASTPINPSPPASSNNGGPSSGWGKLSAAGGPFLFKLVPPKAGLSRAVQFTKPTIHYFQVDSVHEGRKWMAAMMKATIAYDPASGLETTNKQKTVTLAKARARKERPPALQGEDDVEQPPPGPTSADSGLNIRGLGSDDAGPNGLPLIGSGPTVQKVRGSEAGPLPRNRAVSVAAPYQNVERAPS